MPKEKKETVNKELISIEEPCHAIALYKITPAEIAERLKAYQHLKVIPGDTASYKEVRAALTALVHTRTEVDKRRKKLGEDLRKSVSNINQAGKMLIEPMAPYEQRFISELKAEDDRKDAIKAEKDRLERERKEGIQAKITAIFNRQIALHLATGAELRELSGNLEDMEIKEAEYMEFTEEAEKVLEDSYNAVQESITARIKLDKEAEERKAEDERLEKIRIKQKADQALIDERNKTFDDSKEWFKAHVRGDSFQTPSIENVESAIDELQSAIDIKKNLSLRFGCRMSEEPALKLLLKEQIEEAHGILKFRKDQAKLVKAQKKIDDEKAKLEAEKKADADRKKQEEWEKDEKARLLLELEEKKAEAEQERIEKERAEEVEKERKAGMAPDKEKLTKWIEGFNETAIPTPSLKTKKAKEILRVAKEQLEMLLQDVMAKIEKL